MLYCGSVWQTLKTAGSSLLRRQREAQISGGSLLPACHEFQKSQSLVLMTSSLFFYCGKQEDPLSQTPVVSQKVFEAAKLFQAKVFQAAVWFYDTRFVCIYFLKSRFLKRHTHCSFVYLLTYCRQASGHSVSSSHIQRRKSWGRVARGRWLQMVPQRISQIPSEQAKARLV